MAKFPGPSGKGPRSRRSRETEGLQAINDLPAVQVSFDDEAFMHRLRAHGIRVTHYRAIPDPRGMVSRGDNHDVHGQRDSSDGFIFKEAGTCQALFVSNGTEVSMEDIGNMSFSTAFLTFPDKYENGNPVIIMPWDRFFLEDIEIRVGAGQYIEANRNGIDKLQYPATCVEHLIDADGIEYVEDKHFKITKDGDIEWLGQIRPGFDIDNNRGKVYAIRYRHTPFFIAAHLVHEIRVAQVTDQATFERQVKRMPYQVQVIREHVLHDKNRNGEPVIDDRFQQYPVPSGNTGPIGLPSVAGVTGPTRSK
jgi:hypothetical protein